MTIFKHLQRHKLKIWFFLGIFLFSFYFSYFIINSFQTSINNIVQASSEQVAGELTSLYRIDSAFISDNDSLFASNNNKILKSEFKSVDKRIYVFEKYFELRNSPLQGYAHLFVEACDRYGAPKDCISTVAIARHETDLCNYYNSAEMHNCMGWGGGGEHRMTFNSFKEHIDTATNVLVFQYGPEFMDDPRRMERVFCGPQAECDNWGNRILFFMREIDNFAESLGVGRLTDLRGDGLRY